jgi:hypothetical protein
MTCALASGEIREVGVVDGLAGGRFEALDDLGELHRVPDEHGVRQHRQRGHLVRASCGCAATPRRAELILLWTATDADDVNPTWRQQT